MRFLRRLWGRLRDWWAGRIRYRASRVTELPDSPRPGRVYLEGERGEVWVAALICPCGCGELIQLNLQPDQRPRWGVTEHADGAVTINPSIWRHVGCKSHFFLRTGLVAWCDSRR